ncbi:tRNA (adenosine(37)-N6)-threonylcarbamoyltransferase complex dimerization subunit type 1 TsaB [Curtobacterium aetherium]|uniref:tRNA (adenosine(37)-N6)-threonylcarbamoyltransferase complex dimerization subunit type 1 TsaB n=1 Tax=Curtobacterium aetherium TaxID=2841594 RepID=UPI003B52AE22
MLLAIDTSAGTSVAVVDPTTRQVLAVRETDDTRRHAEVVGPFLDEVLRDAGITPADVTGVAAGMGPGPFTGLRVGIAAARTFAAARGVPVLPVVSHDAVAAGQDGPLVVLTDARRREVAWSAYDTDGVRVAGPGLARPADLDDVLRASRADTVDWRRVTAAAIPAGRLGVLVADRLASGAPLAADTPVYLREPDVTVPGAPKRVAR